MYGVPETTSSRVPDTRPGRPSAGNRLRFPTASKIAATVGTAAAGLSREMYSASASKFASASSRHLSCTAGPAFQGLLDLFFAGKFSAIGGGNGLLDFGDLPFVDGDKFLDRLGGDERAAPVHRFR